MPIVTGITQRSVNLSWVPSFDFHHSPISHYVIHYREGLEGPWDVANAFMTPDNRTQFEIIGLKPFSTYSFRVLAVNAIGVSEPSRASYPVMTLRKKPDSRVNIMSARNVSANAIKLEWLAPAQTEIHGEFLGYRIKYVHQLHEPALPLMNDSSSSIFASFGGASDRFASRRPPIQPPKIEQPSLDGPQAKEIVVKDPNQTSYTVKNLETYTLYKFSVQVLNLAGEGPVAEVLAHTDEGGE